MRFWVCAWTVALVFGCDDGDSGSATSGDDGGGAGGSRSADGEGAGGGHGDGHGGRQGQADGGPGGSGGSGADASPSAEAGAPDAAPPVVCEPKAGGTAVFTDATEAFGIGREGLDVEGIRISGADLDDDGYADVVVHQAGSNVKTPADAPAPYFVLMNRPGEAGTRVFEDATFSSRYGRTRAGVNDRVAHLAVYGDVDNDGDLDVFSGVYTDSAGDSGDRSLILLNDGSGDFEPAPASDIEALKLATTSATFLDYDRDGLLDLFAGNGYDEFGNLGATEQDRLYRGHGDGTFSDVTDEAGLTTRSPVLGRNLDLESLNAGKTHRPTYGAAACDLDGDGDAEILTVSYGRQPNALYVNLDGHYDDESVHSRFAFDEEFDYTDNEFYRCYCVQTGDCDAPAPRIECGDQLLWSPGIDDQPFRLGGNTFAVSCADLDDDGRADVLTGEIKHWHIGSSSDASQVLRNVGEPDAVRFERPGNAALGLERRWRAETYNEGDIYNAIFDYDLDGRKDIYWGSTDYPETTSFLFRQGPDGTFEDVTDAASLRHDRAAGLALVDVDRDGDLDAVIGSSPMRCGANDVPPCPWVGTGADVFLFLNDASERNHWIAIDLEGKDGVNRTAIGAKVRVTAGGRTQHYEVVGAHGHFGGQDGTTLHIGLGEACAIDDVEVQWPDAAGTVTHHAGLHADTFVLLGSDGSSATR